MVFGAKGNGGRATAVLFAMEGCQICAKLAEPLATLPNDRRGARFVWVDGSSPSPPHRVIEDVPGWLYGSANDDRVHRQWDVSAVPFCFIVAPDGRIADKRLINRREDLERALDAVLVSAAKGHTISKELIS